MPDASGSQELPAETVPEATEISTPSGASKEDWWSRTSSALTERGQDIVSSVVAATLLVLAAAILIAAIVDFFPAANHRGLTTAAALFLDQILLVLILVEIVHTVVVSIRAHSLAAQPFLVVGLVAVIRKILFGLAGQQKISNTTLGIYIGMVGVFVAALIFIEVFGGRRRSRSADDSAVELE